MARLASGSEEQARQWKVSKVVDVKLTPQMGFRLVYDIPGCEVVLIFGVTVGGLSLLLVNDDRQVCGWKALGRGSKAASMIVLTFQIHLIHVHDRNLTVGRRYAFISLVTSPSFDLSPAPVRVSWRRLCRLCRVLG